MQFLYCQTTRVRRALARFGMRGVAAIILTCWASLVGMPDAAADPPPPGSVELSVDGIHWANPLTDPIFPSDLVWVPGDSIVGSVWVRTTCAAASGVATWQLDPDDPPRWADDLLVRTRAAGSNWGQSLSFSECEATTEFTVKAGSPVKLDLEISFPWGNATNISGNDTQARMVEIENAAITLACDGVTTTRPALNECQPATVVVVPNGIDDDNSDSGDGSISTDSSGSAEGSASASGILAYGGARGKTALTGVEIASTLLASATLILAGATVLTKVKSRLPRAKARGAGHE